MDHFVDALVAESLHDLARLGALDLPQLVGIEVHEAARELTTVGVAREPDHLAGGEVSLHLHDARGQQALAMLGQCLERTRVDREPPDAIQFLEVTDREAVALMLEQDRYLDLIIPRGGEAFVRWVAERSRVPVLKHDKGLVHVFVDADADLDMATAIVVNAKAQRPSVCNALETLLVDRTVAERFLPLVATRLAEAGVELRGCPRTVALVPSARPATEADWDEEYLDLVLAIRVVDDLDAALAHIRRHGTGLAEAIVTNDLGRARRFTREVDAAGVLVNASTRLLDGQQFGMGAEMGISTSRVHARGPVGVRALTTTKFVVQGDGQVRD